MNYQMEKVLEIGKSFPVNDELAGIVPMATPDEQAILTADIAKNGLLQPVILYKGKVVDGRCRQKACLTASKQIRAIDLDENLNEDEVKAYVKAVNTRRNLTRTQKVMIASKESDKPNITVFESAQAWGVSKTLVKNGRWILKNYPMMAEDLFNGKSVELSNGQVTNKVSSIFAYLKAKQESISEDTEYGWDEDSYIQTQSGKNWYYEQKALINAGNNTKALKLIAELANYKFKANAPG